MASVNALIVKRSNVLLGYSNHLSYYEAKVHTSFTKAFNDFLGTVYFGTSLFFPPLTYLLRKFVLPKPG